MDPVMDEGAFGLVIVKVAAMFLIGVLLITGIGTNISENSRVTLTLSDQPANGDTVQLDGHIYEFSDDANVGTGNIPIIIESSLNDTADNFAFALSENYEVIAQ